MSIKIKAGEFADIDESKFFGEILLPEKWLKDDIFGEEEIFLCQIKLEDIAVFDKANLLPKSGTLYFFLDESFGKAKGKVRYFDGVADAYTDFNEGYEDCEEEIPVLFEDCDNPTGSAMLCRDEKVLDSEVCLLRIDADELGIEFLKDAGGMLYFTIEKDALRKKDFSAAIAFVGEQSN